MGASKLNNISDPLGQQKTSAANLGLQNYQTASSNVPSLQNFYNQNYGQSAQQTLGNQDPLFQQLYGSVQGDINGTGGPFTSLQKNLLGAFDQQANQAQAAQNSQLQSEGIYSSGLGLGANNNLQANLATQRGALASQVGTQEMNFADQLSQQLMQQNQLMGQQDPMAALQAISSLSSPPNLGDISNMYYQPSNNTAQLLGAILPAIMNGPLSQQGMSGIQQAFSSPSTPSGITSNTAYSPAGMSAFNANMPGLALSSM